MTAIAATWGASSTSASAASGWICARVGSSTIGDKGAVEVESDDGAIGYADQVRVAMLTLQRRELHASSQSRNAQYPGRTEVKLLPIG